MTSVVSRVTIDNPDNLVGRAPSRPDPLAGPMPDAGVRRGPREAVNDSFWASSANRTETNFPFDGKVSFFFAKNIIAHFCLVRKRLNWVEVESIERFRSTCECRSSLLRFAS